VILSSLGDVYERLIAARTRAEVEEILRLLGDHPSIELDQKFGPFDLQWHAFGDNPSNISTIGLATKPGRSLTERLTNAMDALLEERAIPGVATPASSRIAAMQWFGRNETAPDDGLFKSNVSGLDRHVAAVIVSSEEESAATIDVIDDGIGIRPENFASTILSLQGGNKITKRYLIGAFGQGGASTLAFADYVLISSRHRDTCETVGFTVVRVLRLDATYKEDSYAYLAIRDGSGVLTVPSITVASAAIDPYPDYDDPKKPAHGKGTLVRHYSYTLSKLDKTLQASPGNLYHYLHVLLFDPLFPFRLLDLRQRGKEKDELISGSRNRLMKLVKQSGKGSDEDQELGSQIAHYRPMEYVVPFGSEEPSIGIEYWVVLNYRKSQGKPVLRGSSNDLFVQPNHPVVATMNGQNQGELSGQILRDLGLGIVSRHIVIHIDATKVNSQVRRELFSTSREGMKDGDVLDHLIRVLTSMLKEDQALFAIERELTERIAKKETEATSEEVKRQVSKLLIEAGFEMKNAGPAAEPGSGEKQPMGERKRGRPTVAEPLPTLAFPGATKFVIVTPKPTMEVRLNDNEVILVETDADAEFDKRGLIAIRTEPPHLELAAHTPLRGGRVRWRLRPVADAKPGDAGVIITTLTKLDGTQLTDSTSYEVFPAMEEKARKGKSQIPPFEIIAINPDDNPEQWNLAWPDHGFEDSKDELKRVSYKPIRQSGGIYVYYSTIYPPLQRIVDQLKLENPVLLQIFKAEYEVWIAYHAILQESSRPTQGDEQLLDSMLEEERIRVAALQAKQAFQNAKLREKQMKEAAVQG
jgi:hypothetical protein